MKERIWSRGERSELHQNVPKTGSKWMKSEQLRRASELKRSEGRGGDRSPRVSYEGPEFGVDEPKVRQRLSGRYPLKDQILPS
jgi:hypothetical protein